MEQGECLLVYAAGADGAAGAWNAPFKLPASGGDTLVLFNAQGKAVDAVSLPELESDASYARQEDGGWAVRRRATPGAPNDAAAEAAQLSGVRVETDAVELSEVMSGNTLYFPCLLYTSRCV